MSDEKQQIELTAEQIEIIAEKAAEKAIKNLTEEVYKTIGKSVISKLTWIIGSLVVGAYFWANQHGLLK